MLDHQKHHEAGDFEKDCRDFMRLGRLYILIGIVVGIGCVYALFSSGLSFEKMLGTFGALAFVWIGTIVVATSRPPKK